MIAFGVPASPTCLSEQTFVVSCPSWSLEPQQCGRELQTRQSSPLSYTLYQNARGNWQRVIPLSQPSPSSFQTLLGDGSRQYRCRVCAAGDVCTDSEAVVATLCESGVSQSLTFMRNTLSLADECLGNQVP